MAQQAEIWFGMSQSVIWDVRMHRLSCKLSWLEKQEFVLETDFPILRDLYQQKMALTILLTTTSIFVSLGCQCLARCTSLKQESSAYSILHWGIAKKSTRRVWKIPSFLFCPLKLIFSTPLHMNLLCPIYIDPIPCNFLPIEWWVFKTNQLSCLTCISIENISSK